MNHTLDTRALGLAWGVGLLGAWGGRGWLRVVLGVIVAMGVGEVFGAETHWSFRPVQRPVVPAVQAEGWGRNPVDSFVLARLELEGLRPAPEADRLTWLRRVTFDLTGLPPSIEEVERFRKDTRGGAHERVVDALLSSPRHGERWAQHWLDVVRYADTHGFEVNTERTNAWPYRDYVIQAVNRSTPYDRFIREQIVGDAMGEDTATGFLITASALLSGQIGADDVSKRLARQDALDEIVVNTGQTFLGLSVGCARCHDHKFDPITAREYYSMQAFYAGVEYEDREIRSAEVEMRRREVELLKPRLETVERRLGDFEPLARVGLSQTSGAGPLRRGVVATKNVDRFQPKRTRSVRFTVRTTNNLEPCVDELEVVDVRGRNVALASLGTRVRSSGDTVVAERHELRQIHDGRYGNSRSWMSNENGKGWVILEFAEEHEVDRVIWGRDREGQFKDRLATSYTIEVGDAMGGWVLVADSTDRHPFGKGEPSGSAIAVTTRNAGEAAEVEGLLAEKARLEKTIAEGARGRMAFAGLFRKPDTIRVLHRGDPEQPKDEVVPAVPVALGAMRLPKETTERQRRHALAEWISSPDNPLTARVMVNRIWQGHFGVGLVETSSDLGKNGTKPSHPELLDWLADTFVRSGWSIKTMHRLIVLSATYRQSTRHEAVAASKDVDNRLLWRFPSRRLESESIRDSMLFVSGNLNLAVGGRGFDLFNFRGGLVGFQPVETFGSEGHKRMIYAHKVRREREGVFGAFDCPDAGQSTARRRESTTPIQALNLFNSRFTVDQARVFAERVEREGGGMRWLGYNERISSRWDEVRRLRRWWRRCQWCVSMAFGRCVGRYSTATSFSTCHEQPAGSLCTAGATPFGSAWVFDPRRDGVGLDCVGQDPERGRVVGVGGAGD